jgi:hypothetical protein
MTCEELAAQLTATQAQLTTAQSALNATNLAIASTSLQILGDDPGAIVPLTAANVAIRMAQLATQMPPNYVLLAEYTALSGLWLQAAITATQIAYLQLAISGIQAQQAAQGC